MARHYPDARVSKIDSWRANDLSVGEDDFAGAIVGHLVGRLVGRRVGRWVGRLVGSRVGRWVGRLVGRLVGRRVGRLVGGASAAQKNLSGKAGTLTQAR